MVEIYLHEVDFFSPQCKTVSVNESVICFLSEYEVSPAFQQ